MNSMTVNDWRQVVFSDEVRFGLRSDGRVYVWRTSGERYEKYATVAKCTSKQSIMFWGCITPTGVGRLLKCPSPYRHMDYIDILTDAGISLLSDFNLVFMDDNAPVHRAMPVRDWCVANQVEVIDWPARSPDLNIENIWGMMKNAINNLPNRPTDLFQLEHAVFDAWNAISAQILTNLYVSALRRKDTLFDIKIYRIVND
jgi:hypothetical protein